MLSGVKAAVGSVGCLDWMLELDSQALTARREEGSLVRLSCAPTAQAAAAVVFFRVLPLAYALLFSPDTSGPIRSSTATAECYFVHVGGGCC